MADTYGHDEAMRDLDNLRADMSGMGCEYGTSECDRLAAYLTRLEAADTRLLAAAEARNTSLLAALAAVGHRTESGCATCTLDRACTSTDGNGDWPCPPIADAAIEQRKEGRS